MNKTFKESCFFVNDKFSMAKVLTKVNKTGQTKQIKIFTALKE
jgi:hypothetical protein